MARKSGPRDDGSKAAREAARRQRAMAERRPYPLWREYLEDGWRQVRPDLARTETATPGHGGPGPAAHHSGAPEPARRPAVLGRRAERKRPTAEVVDLEAWKAARPEADGSA